MDYKFDQLRVYPTSKRSGALPLKGGINLKGDYFA